MSIKHSFFPNSFPREGLGSIDIFQVPSPLPPTLAQYLKH